MFLQLMILSYTMMPKHNKVKMVCISPARFNVHRLKKDELEVGPSMLLPFSTRDRPLSADSSQLPMADHQTPAVDYESAVGLSPPASHRHNTTP